MTAALPVIPAVGCAAIPGLSAVCGLAGGVGSSILGAGAGDILGTIASSVAQGAAWLIGQIGGVMSASTSIDLGAAWFKVHYEVMLALAAIVLVPLLMASVIQAVYRQSVSQLVRSALVHLPLALLLGAVAVQLVQLALAGTDALSAAVSSASSGGLGSALTNLAAALAGQVTGNPGAPAFVTLLGAAFVSFGALLLWIELLVRSAAVYVATLFFPLALASLVWPAISQWCRRLVETVAALILSKFVIVAVLSLAVGALGAGDGSFSSELAGGALLLLAGFAPFTLLRLVPMVESGAVHHLEGARHRVQHAALEGPRSAAAFAMRAAPAEALPELVAGTGVAALPEAPGSPPSHRGPGEGARPRALEAPTTGLPMWRGLPEGTDAASTAGAGPAGPPPLWGAPVTVGGRPAAERGSHLVGHDDLGPVLRWRPAGRDGDPGGPDGG